MKVLVEVSELAEYFTDGASHEIRVDTSYNRKYVCSSLGEQKRFLIGKKDILAIAKIIQEEQHENK